MTSMPGRARRGRYDTALILNDSPGHQLSDPGGKTEYPREPAARRRGNFDLEGSGMAQEGIPFGVGDTFSVSTWGRLSPGDIARRGIDVLMGIVRSYHADCGDPLHFWCAPEGIRVFVMADLYQSGNEQGEHYIGCYLRGADFDNEGVPHHSRDALPENAHATHGRWAGVCPFWAIEYTGK